MGSKATAPDMSIEAHGVRGLERSEEEMRLLFEDWFAEHGRAYNALGEKERRFEIFKDNVRRIDAHNAEADAGLHTYHQGINQFTAMTKEERANYCCGYRPRAKGAVAAVKDQGSCDK